jgi:hypothetical protein
LISRQFETVSASESIHRDAVACMKANAGIPLFKNQLADNWNRFITTPIPRYMQMPE